VTGLEAELTRRDAQLGELRRIVEAQDLRLVALKTPEASGAGGPTGRILWDPAQRKWYIYVFDLKPPAPGRIYELWFITPDQKKVPAGLIAVGPDGRGSAVAELPKDLGPVALAAITDEPGLVQAPTGQIHLVGQVQP
jgi:hypothetical protein